MKRLLFLSVLILALMATLLLAVGPAAAKATRTEFTAIETYVEDLAPGTEWVTGTDNNQIDHVRGGKGRFTVVASDARVSGDEVITINYNMKVVDPPVYITGRMWGTFRITNGGGAWEGTFTGLRDEQGYSYIEYVGSGGGGYAGLQIRVHDERLDPDPTALYHWIGYVLDPGQ